MSTLRELYPKDGSVRQHHGRHVLLEYVMLQGINDSLVDAHRLLVLTEGIECKYNLIGFNPHAGTRFLPSPPEQVRFSSNSSQALPCLLYLLPCPTLANCPAALAVQRGIGPLSPLLDV